MKNTTQDIINYIKGDEQKYNIRIETGTQSISEDIAEFEFVQVLEIGIIGNVATTKIKFKLFNDNAYTLNKLDVYLVLGESLEQYLGKFNVINTTKEDKASDEIIVEAEDNGMFLNKKANFNIEFPTTLKSYLDHVVQNAGLELENETIINNDYSIQKQPFFEDNATYRDVISKIAEVSCSNVIITTEGKVKFIELKKETDFNLSLEDMFEHVEENIKVGDYNTVVASRIQADDMTTTEDVVYPEELEEERLEYKIIENWIIDEDRAGALPEILQGLQNFSYFPIETEIKLIPFLEVGDLISIDLDKKHFVQEFTFNANTGLATIKSFNQLKTESDYKVATSRDKRKFTELKVNKLEGKITSIVEHTDELESQISEVTQTAEGLTATVTERLAEIQEKILELNLSHEELELIFKLQNGNNLIKNSVMRNGTKYWFKEIHDMYISDKKPENPIPNQLWFNDEELEGYERNTMYQWNAVSEEWEKSLKTKKEIIATGVEGFTQFENQESRENSISNSIILMDAGNVGEKTHLFGITEGISIPTDTEMISIGLKVKNQIRTGNIYVAYGFAPIEPASMFGNEMLYGLYEEWYKITPDDFTNGYTKVERHLKVPKKEDLLNGIKSDTAPEDTTLSWLDTNTGIYPKLKRYNTETGEWQICDKCNSVLVDGFIYTYREFYSGYYKTIYTEEDFKPNYLFVALTCYPSFNIATGATLPETAERDNYFGIMGSADTQQDIIYRAKFRDGEFESWIPTGIPTVILLMDEYKLPAPPFPGERAVPISGQFYFTDLKAESGLFCTAWTPHLSETYEKNYKADGTGIEIASGENKMFIDENEILATYNNEEVFKITENLSRFKYLEAEKAKLAGLNMQKAKIGNSEMVIMF